MYGQHLKQILITTGGMIVAEQLIHVLWGPDLIPLPRPATLRGSFLIGDMAIEKYRLVAVVVGLAVFAAMLLLLNRTKIGLLIRAGVENKEMVEAMGYRIRRLFVGVFVAGSALAGLGGALWGMYQESVTVHIGAQMMVLIFIVIIIGGLGSVGGCFVGALLVGLVANYVGYLVAEDRARLQHPADGADPAVAAAGALSGEQAMIGALLSGDLPRSRVLSALLVADLRRARAGAVPVSRHAAAGRRRQGLRVRAAGGELRPAARLYRHRVLRPHHVLRHRRLRRRHRAVAAGRRAGARSRWAPPRRSRCRSRCRS